MPECYDTPDCTMICKDLLSPQLGILYAYTCKLHFGMES